jgi:cytosine/adenosine deaminase-related metal-dependent hydrolase
MVLDNVHIAGSNQPVSIRIGNGKIAAIDPESSCSKTGHLHLSFNGALVFPGIINSHDHLDFNLFPQLGNAIYNNYTEWGKHIHRSYKEEIAAVLKVPFLLRAQWGVFKNLLCGVTTVVNHGERFGLKNAPVTIFEDSHCLHSVHFEKNWKLKLNNPFKKELPVNIHTGEGTDDLSANEVDQLIKYNLLKRRLIGVHGVSMSARQAMEFDALVWCPESNYFLLNKTAQVDVLQNHTNILFGTDSTLTGHWNIWHHLRLARKTGLLSDDALYNSLNKNPAAVWQLNAGAIAVGRDADLVIAKQSKAQTGLDTFFALNPADLLLVVHKGEISLFDRSVLTQLHHIDVDGFSSIFIEDSCKYVKGDVPGLMANIKEYLPTVNFPVSADEMVKYDHLILR